MTTQNTSLILASHPVVYPLPGIDLKLSTTTIELSLPPPQGGLLLKTNYLSYDPFLRNKMKPGGSPYSRNFILVSFSISHFSTRGALSWTPLTLPHPERANLQRRHFYRPCILLPSIRTWGFSLWHSSIFSLQHYSRRQCFQNREHRWPQWRIYKVGESIGIGSSFVSRASRNAWLDSLFVRVWANWVEEGRCGVYLCCFGCGRAVTGTAC